MPSQTPTPVLRRLLSGLMLPALLTAVLGVLLALPQVVDVHHVHIWSLSTSQVAMTAHLCRRVGELDDMDLLHRAKDAVAALGVEHCTLQLEPAPAG